MAKAAPPGPSTIDAESGGGKISGVSTEATRWSVVSGASAERIPAANSGDRASSPIAWKTTSIVVSAGCFVTPSTSSFACSDSMPWISPDVRSPPAAGRRARGPGMPRTRTERANAGGRRSRRAARTCSASLSLELVEQERPEPPQAVSTGVPPSRDLSEPSPRAAFVRSSPPMSTPRTNTWGNVGQPLQSLMARRSRHFEK